MFKQCLAAVALCAASLHAFADDVVRLGNLKFAHYGAVSYMKVIGPKYGLKIEERMFAKGWTSCRRLWRAGRRVGKRAGCRNCGACAGRADLRRGRVREGRCAPRGEEGLADHQGGRPQGERKWAWPVAVPRS